MPLLPEPVTAEKVRENVGAAVVSGDQSEPRSALNHFMAPEVMITPGLHGERESALREINKCGDSQR
jgi:hypothetical protein